MKTTQEGLLIHKWPHQERHLIGTILLRSGQKLPVLFYGGQGGGKRQKGVNLEMGFMLRLEVSKNQKSGSHISCSDWSCLWEHQKIQHNHKAFYLLSFYCELIKFLAPEAAMDLESHDCQSEGIFRTLSNAIFHLEQALVHERFSKENELLVFLSKLAIQEGVFPNPRNCLYCGVDLLDKDNVHLSFEEGGFICPACQAEEDIRVAWPCQDLHFYSHAQYKDIPFEGQYNLNLSKEFWAYLLFQFQMESHLIKSSSLVLT